MQCLKRFQTKMRSVGSSLREEHIRNSRKLMRETFADDASYSLGIYMWELGFHDYEHRPTIEIRLFERAFSNANGWTVKFQTMIETPIVAGDVIYDSKTDEYLICTESFNIDDIHWQGKFTLCNWILKWQNKNGDILEYPCNDINSTQYNSGEQSNKQFTIGSSQHLIILPCDENTIALASPQRFFLDKNKVNPTSFIVTQNDTTSYGYGKKGLVRVTLYECATNNDTDRIDLGICDYFEKDEIRTDNSDHKAASKAVISYSTTVIKSGGDTQVFYGSFIDELGNELLDIAPNWKIVCDFSDALQVEEVDRGVAIGIDDDSYIDEEFKLVLSDEGGNLSSDIIIRVESLL